MREFTKNKKQEAIELWEKGLSVPQIQDKINISRKFIAKYLAEIGLRRPSKCKLSKEISLKAIQMHKDGKTKKYISERLNITIMALDNAFLMHGYNPPKIQRVKLNLSDEKKYS